MIKIKYKALFTLGFAHTFYKSGKTPDIVMEPSGTCADLIKSFGLKFLSTDFGGILYAKVDSADIMKNPLPEGTKFTFLLKLKNTLFGNITNINLIKPKNTHYYFNNLTANVSANEPLLVANITSKIVSDSDLLPFANRSFSFSHSSTDQTKTGDLHFIDSGERFQQVLNNADNIFNFSFDLNKSNGGRAHFLIDGIDKTTFFAIDPSELSDLFGVVEIFYKSSLPNEYQFQNNDHSIHTKNYIIPFENRLTKWRYIITKQFNTAISAVTVAKTNGTVINFSLLGSSPPGKFIVSSNNALPLKEEPIMGIKLTDNNNKVIIANMPNPPLNLIKTEGADTFSDILITI